MTARTRRSGPPQGSAGPRTGRQRVRAGERRRAVPAPRPQPRRHRARARPAATRASSPAGRRVTCCGCCSRCSRRTPRTSPTTRSSASPTTRASGTSSSGSATSPAGCTPDDRGARRRGSRCGSTSATSCSNSSARWCSSPGDTAALAGRHVDTLMPDQTYLQQAQPSTFGHYLLSFAYPALRDAQRLLDELDDINRSPGGAGCVNGTRLLDDRTRRRRARLRRGHRAHPRRDVAGRRPDPRAGDGGQPAVHSEQARRGPGDLVQQRVRLRRPGRRASPGRAS